MKGKASKAKNKYTDDFLKSGRINCSPDIFSENLKKTFSIRRTGLTAVKNLLKRYLESDSFILIFNHIFKF